LRNLKDKEISFVTM